VNFRCWPLGDLPVQREQSFGLQSTNVRSPLGQRGEPCTAEFEASTKDKERWLASAAVEHYLA